jgi:hypothetical protein
MRGGDMPIAPLTAGGHAYSPLWTLDYLAAPFAMIGPLLVIATIAVWRMLRRRPREEVLSFSSRHRRLGTIFLVCTAAPILLFYLAVSFVAEPEQNWALAGFVTIAVLAGWYAADELARRRAGANDPTLTAPGTFRTRPIQVLWRLAILYGLCAALVLHRGDLVALALNRIGSVPIVANVFERLASRPGRPIITGRLIGSERMAAHAARILDGLRAEHPGSAPFIMAEHYGRASQLAYYLSRAGRPETVLSPQSVMGGRRSQFDFWADTALDGPQLLDQPALLLSNDKPVTLERWRGMFERVEPLGPPWSAGPKLDGEHKKDRVAYLGYGYRGPPDGHAQRSSRLRKARPSPQQ